MKSYLVIHGHFYQPPRENPWIGLIPKQSSAYPYENWNLRINKECYAANAASRVLNARGEIVDIINNYQYISFNFGPTLLSWLYENDRETYDKILDADKKSARRNNGHGNAIAQAYNHTILPLATEDDIKTQIHWGIKDFSYRFGRDPEGLWLPETAINQKVLNILIEFGIRFIILSPWQADSVRLKDSGIVKKFHGQPIAANKAYILKGSRRGEITGFFYNHILARGISFEHYLKNADFLYEKIISFHNKAQKGNLIHTATDGEIYGHHRTFGDMCLAALSKKVSDSHQLKMTNYGRYLELFPPEDIVLLKPGEEDKGTSWSCFHGVSRWYKDCGCNTGSKEGWNQQWRTPLRDGLNALNDKLRGIYENELAKLTQRNAGELRNRYIDVLTGEQKRESFAEAVLENREQANSNARVKLFRLLESQKYAMFMFTSCGWFFADLAGIETIQNLQYAFKAIQMCQTYTQEDLLEPLLEYLNKAKSNAQDKEDGRSIMENLVIPPASGFEQPAALFIFTETLGNKKIKNYGFFRLISIRISESPPGDMEEIHYSDGSYTMEYKGVVEIQDTQTLAQASFRFQLIVDFQDNIYIHVVNQDYPLIEHSFGVEHFPDRIKEQFTNFARKIEVESLQQLQTLFPKVKKVLINSKNMKIQPSLFIRKTAELSINSAILNLIGKIRQEISQDIYDTLKYYIYFCKNYAIPLSNERLEDLLTTSLVFNLEKLPDQIGSKELKLLYRIVELFKEAAINPDLTIPQNRIFYQLKKLSARFGGGDFKRELFYKYNILITFGSVLGLDTQEMKDRIMEL